ncbi:hypothetical protein [Streptomyces puniciscabiei]|nr:hypothetical protein [Streptomyces puniciscabiei]
MPALDIPSSKSITARALFVPRGVREAPAGELTGPPAGPAVSRGSTPS